MMWYCIANGGFVVYQDKERWEHEGARWKEEGGEREGCASRKGNSFKENGRLRDKL